MFGKLVFKGYEIVMLRGGGRKVVNTLLITSTFTVI